MPVCPTCGMAYLESEVHVCEGQGVERPRRTMAVRLWWSFFGGVIATIVGMMALAQFGGWWFGTPEGGELGALGWVSAPIGLVIGWFESANKRRR